MVELKLIESVVVLLLFSIGFGIALRQFKLDKYKSLMIGVYFSIILVISVFIANIFDKAVTVFVNNNINFLMTVIGMVLIFIGFRFIYELKSKKKLPFSIVENNDLEEFSIKSKFLNRYKIIKDNLSLPLFFILGYIGILINILYTAPKLWMSIIPLAVEFAVVSVVVLILFYYISNKLKKFLYNSFIGIYSVLSGIYLLIVYMFIPPLQVALSTSSSSMSLPDPTMLGIAMVILIISIVVGYFIKKSKRFRDLIW